MSADPGKQCVLHGTCVALAGQGVLLRGKPGAGKSDLALRLLGRHGDDARLVSDDQVVLVRDGETLIARAPDPIAGKLEVRGVGIVPAANVDSAPLALIVDLVSPGIVPRMPEAPLPEEEIMGVAVSVAQLDPFEQSAPEKLKLLVMGRF